jgi:hypothetical protein
MKSCGCTALPRRLCQVCVNRGKPFVACSRRCLERHRGESHGQREPLDSGAQARAAQFALNRQNAGARDLYRQHRERLMRLARAAQRAEGLCVLGAGNADDLDLAEATESFGEVHLVDLDPHALAQAIDGQPDKVRRRVVTHAPVDLTGGAIDRIDEWGECTPQPQELSALAGSTAREVAARLGRTFDVVLSTCTLTQTFLPFKNTLALPATDWERLFSGLALVHLSVMSALTRDGGTAVLVTEVMDSRSEPSIEALVERLGPEPPPPHLRAEPDLRTLLLLLERAPGLASQVASRHLTSPWLWNLGALRLLCYALVFRVDRGNDD